MAFEEEFQITRTDAAGLARRDRGDAAEFRETEWRGRGEAIALRATERRVLTGRGEEMDVVLQELARPIFPAPRALDVGVAVEARPPEAVIMERVGLVIIDRLVHAVDEPAAADGHAFEHVE